MPLLLKAQSGTELRISNISLQPSFKTSFFFILVLTVLILTGYFTLLDSYAYEEVFEAFARGQVVTLKNPLAPFFEAYRYGSFRILDAYSLALCYQLFKYSVLGYKIINLIYHIIVCFLVYKFAFLLCEHWISSVSAALLYSVSPYHGETIIFLFQQQEQLSTIFFILSLYYYLKQVVEKGRIPGKYYKFSILFFILGIRSKETHLCLPFMIIALDILLLHESVSNTWKKRLLLYLPYFIILSIAILLKLSQVSFTTPYYVKPISYYLDNFTMVFQNAFLNILKILIYPLRISNKKPGTAENFIFFSAIAIIFLNIAVTKKPPIKTLLFILIWVGITVFPLIPFLAGYHEPSIYGGRRFHLPAIGVMIGLGYFLNFGLHKNWQKFAGISGTFLLLIVNFLALVHGNALWKVDTDNQGIFFELLASQTHDPDDLLTTYCLDLANNYCYETSHFQGFKPRNQECVQVLDPDEKPYKDQRRITPTELLNLNFDWGKTDFILGYDENTNLVVDFSDKLYLFQESELYKKTLMLCDSITSLFGDTLNHEENPMGFALKKNFDLNGLKIIKKTFDPQEKPELIIKDNVWDSSGRLCHYFPINYEKIRSDYVPVIAVTFNSSDSGYQEECLCSMIWNPYIKEFNKCTSYLVTLYPRERTEALSWGRKKMNFLLKGDLSDKTFIFPVRKSLRFLLEEKINGIGFLIPKGIEIKEISFVVIQNP